MKWVKLKDILNTDAVPAGAAFIISEAIKEAYKRGDITRANEWQLIEYLCAEYLLGEVEE